MIFLTPYEKAVIRRYAIVCRLWREGDRGFLGLERDMAAGCSILAERTRLTQDRVTLSVLTLATGPFTRQSFAMIVRPYPTSPQRTCGVCADISFSAKASCRFVIPYDPAENAWLLSVSFDNCLSN